MTNAKTTVAAVIVGLVMTLSAIAEDRSLDYQVLSTSRTSTMERELNQAAASGYRFLKVSNSPNVFGGKELVVITVRDLGAAAPTARQYKVLSARGISSLEKKLKAAARDGYEYRNQTTMPNVFGGEDVIVILERTESKE
jgi:hypothetical protein